MHSSYSRAGFPCSFQDNINLRPVSKIIVHYYFTVRNCVSCGIEKALINRPIIKINLNISYFLANISNGNGRAQMVVPAISGEIMNRPEGLLLAIWASVRE
jgi:hypothetical protein